MLLLRPVKARLTGVRFVCGRVHIVPPGVRTLRDQLPLVVDPILQSIDGISSTFASTAAAAAGGSGSGSAAPSDPYAVVGRLVDMNMALLRLLGVSHPALDALCDISSR